MGKPKFSINGRMEGLHVIGNASLKYLVGHRSIKVEEIITQAMVLRLWLRTGKHMHKKKLAYCVVMMAGSGLKSVKTKMVTIVHTI
jgi:hypothetical protein